jgi:hypothetical protein
LRWKAQGKLSGPSVRGDVDDTDVFDRKPVVDIGRVGA